MSSVKLRLNTAILHPINTKFKHKPSAQNPHRNLKVQVIELNPLSRRQTSKQTLGYSIEIRSKRTDAHEIFRVRIWRLVTFASDQFVFDGQRLARAEVASVVEGYRLVGGDACALSISLVESVIWK